MYGRLTTKEIKKKHSSTPVGGAETGSRVERTQGKAAAGGPSEVVGCGTEQARLQLVGETAAGGQDSSWWTWQQTQRATQGFSSGK